MPPQTPDNRGQQYRIPRIKLTVVRNGYEPSFFRILSNSGEVFEWLRSYFDGHDREEMLAIILDTKHRVIGIHTVAVGTLNVSLIHPRETFKAAVIMNAAAIILAHNHSSSGDPTPSQDDHTLTTRLVKAGELLAIPVLDHIVVGHESYTSFADRGWISRPAFPDTSNECS